MKELARQKAALEEFSEHQQEEVPIWRKAVNNFETGASPINPYQLPQSGQWLFVLQVSSWADGAFF
jgi:hypothetical protein